jgi:hypothetical protein
MSENTRGFYENPPILSTVYTVFSWAAYAAGLLYKVLKPVRSPYVSLRFLRDIEYSNLMSCQLKQPPKL